MRHYIKCILPTCVLATLSNRLCVPKMSMSRNVLLKQHNGKRLLVFREASQWIFNVDTLS